jgi:hypothetical protein
MRDYDNKNRSKISSSSHSHFTEHLMSVFGKPLKKVTTGENRRSTCKRIEPGSESGRTEKITTGENRQADRDGVLERRNENLSPGTNPRAIEKSTA